MPYREGQQHHQHGVAGLLISTRPHLFLQFGLGIFGNAKALYPLDGRTRPTVLVLDNAKIHHAAAFQARLEAWEAQDVYIFYLPTYSPHLHKIETLWRKIKYEWLRPEAYVDFRTLKTAVWHILDLVGQQYTIQFNT